MKKENNITKKFAFSVVAILVIVLVTNNLNDLTGQPVKSVAKRVTCFDRSGDINTPGYVYYSDGSKTVSDQCFSTRTLLESTCVGGYPHTEGVQCSYGCSGGACKKTRALY